MLTNPSAKRILVYGDSFTFGKIPGGMRYDSATRFTGVMQQELGDKYDVIEEGLRGRFLSGDNPFFPERDGLAQFGPILASHLPLDLVIFLLGTNDSNSGGTRSPSELAAAYSQYLEKISWWCDHLGGFTVPSVLLVAPPPTDESHMDVFADMFRGSQAKTSELPHHLAKFAENNPLHFFDSSTLISASPLDGIHLSKEDNRKLGVSLAAKVREILPV